MRPLARGLTLLLLALPQLAQAQVLVICKSGYYLLETAPDGTPKLTPHAGFKQVIILDQPGPGPGPGPGPTPPPVLTPRGIAIRDAALKAVGDKSRDRTALMLSVFYAEVAKKVRSGDLKTPDAIAIVARQGADMILEKSATDSIQNKPVLDAAWKPMRDSLAAHWTALAQEGAADAAYAALLEECSVGLSASVPRASADAIDLVQLLLIIKTIIDFIMQLFPRGIPGFPR